MQIFCCRQPIIAGGFFYSEKMRTAWGRKTPDHEYVPRKKRTPAADHSRHYSRA